MTKPSTIVIIEDEPQLQQKLSAAFREAGFTVDNAYDGERGVALVVDKKPGVVLLDLVLPRMDGFSVLRELKEDPITKDIPVIVLSIIEAPDTAEYALQLGASAYLAKQDYEPKSVVRKVESVLESLY